VKDLVNRNQGERFLYLRIKLLLLTANINLCYNIYIKNSLWNTEI